MENETKARTEVYEIGYLMVPSIAEENLGAEVTAFKDLLTSHGVTFISDEYPRMMELAYEMSRSIMNKKQKFSYGYFGWVKFEVSTDHTVAIKEMMDKNEIFIRYLMIKTVRENTMSAKRAYKADGPRRKTTHTKTDAEQAPIDEEAVDKEIDALVLE
jgi:ribosomal protein S6